MAIDPHIARGAQFSNPANTLAQIAALRQRDMALAQDQQRQQAAQQEFQRKVAAEEKADLLWDEGLAELDSPDPARKQMAIVKLSRADPQAASALLRAKGIGGTDNDGIGNYNPGDYTSESWAKFHASGYKDPTALVRAYAPPAPFFFNTPGLGAGVGSRGGVGNLPAGSVITQLSTPEEEEAARVRTAGAEAGAKAGATATAEAEANRETKRGPQASLDYVIEQRFRPLIKKGWKTYSGIREFDNLRQQLSTEIRTIFRIPGEGTLSDKEQEQYGLQLPAKLNGDDVNERILNDLQQRVRLRLDRGRPSAATPAAAPSGEARTLNWEDM